MKSSEYLKLHQKATIEATSRVSEANESSLSYRMGEFTSLHVSAHMDIDKTTESLKQVLLFKKEAAKLAIKCSDEKSHEQMARSLEYADNLIIKILGIHI